jgi:hypothetical protein
MLSLPIGYGGGLNLSQVSYSIGGSRNPHSQAKLMKDHDKLTNSVRAMQYKIAQIKQKSDIVEDL